MATFRKQVAGVLIVLLVVLVGVGATSAQEGASPVSTSPVYRASDGGEVDGSSSELTRFDNGVTATLSTSELVAGDMYTLWWVVFNEPQNCSDGVCNMDDVFVVGDDGQITRDETGNRVVNMDGISGANISIQHAAGSYTPDGNLTLSASMGLGEAPGIVIGPGLLDTEMAEVHLVVRTHGPLVDDLFHAQLSTFGGGCEPIDAAPCDDVQYAVHLAPAT